MIERILVPVDGSESATAALIYAFENFPEADITVLHVLDLTAASNHIVMGGRFEDWYDTAKSASDALLKRQRELAAKYGVTVETMREVGDPARTILEYAAENEFDQIVVGSHGRRGAARVLLGSVAETVVRRSRMPVVVIHQNVEKREPVQ
ncbi:universal stress protein (plasmid) [Haloferacaceae archaeon DSL9]